MAPKRRLQSWDSGACFLLLLFPTEVDSRCGLGVVLLWVGMPETSRARRPPPQAPASASAGGASGQQHPHRAPRAGDAEAPSPPRPRSGWLSTLCSAARRAALSFPPLYRSSGSKGAQQSPYLGAASEEAQRGTAICPSPPPESCPQIYGGRKLTHRRLGCGPEGSRRDREKPTTLTVGLGADPCTSEPQCSSSGEWVSELLS